MRWISLLTKDGAKEKYAVGFVTHTVSKTLDDKGAVFTAWRLGESAEQSEALGVFRGENGFDLAKLCVENDVRARRQPVAA